MTKMSNAGIHQSFFPSMEACHGAISRHIFIFVDNDIILARIVEWTRAKNIRR